jgi:hypothetical protein
VEIADIGLASFVHFEHWLRFDFFGQWRKALLVFGEFGSGKLVLC